MATQILDYNNPEGIVNWVEQPSYSTNLYDYCMGGVRG